MCAPGVQSHVGAAARAQGKAPFARENRARARLPQQDVGIDERLHLYRMPHDAPVSASLTVVRPRWRYFSPVHRGYHYAYFGEIERPFRLKPNAHFG